MPVESSDHEIDPENPLQLLKKVREMSFSEVLRKLLKRGESTRKDLLVYAYQQGFDEVQASTLDRYFNGLRVPSGETGDLFFRLLAEHLELDLEDQELLQFAVDMRRKGLMKP